MSLYRASPSRAPSTFLTPGRILVLALSGALLLGASLDHVIGLLWRPHPPAPLTYACTTGVGSTIVEGYDFQLTYDAHAPENMLLSYQRESGDQQRQQISMLPPVACRRQ